MFPWNNFIHSVVYDMIAKIFNTFTFTQTLLGDDTPTGAEKDLCTQKLRDLRYCVKKMIISVFRDGALLDKILEAQRLSDYNEYVKT